MKALRRCVGALLCVLSPLADAGENISNQEIKYVATGWSAEGIFVETVANNMSSQNCGPRFVIDPAHPMVKHMTAMLITAMTTGIRVTLYVDGCAAPNIMILKSVALTK